MWGGWAIYINDYMGLQTQLISGITQGTASFIITLVIVTLVTKIFNFLPDNNLRFIFSPLLTVCITGTSLVTVHFLVGTPEIIATVTPALCVAFVFSVFTVFKLKNNKKLRETNYAE